MAQKDSAMTADLRAMRTEHTVMLTGTPLQNNTTELWALLSLLDSDLFPSLEAFLAEFGTLTGADQVDALKERIRPYLLRRQKGDVLSDSLAPLEETIVWVELTLLQKKMYRAVLESRRDVLVAGLDKAALPSLLNMQMELRKCAQRPFDLSDRSHRPYRSQTSSISMFKCA
jgi:SNF2 family DNA or RNA helicase